MSLSETAFKSDWQSADQIAFNLVSDIRFSDQFSMGLDLDYGRIGVDGEHASLNRFQLEPTMHFVNGSYAGAYYQDASVTVSPLGISLQSYGAFVGYDNKNWSVETYVGTTQLSVFSESVSSTNIGVSGTLRPTDNLEVFGRFDRGQPSDEIGISEMISMSAIGAQYVFPKGIMAYGVLERFNLMGQYLNGFAVGGGYDLAAYGAKIPGTVTIEFARADAGQGLTQSQVAVGWLIPLGNGKVQPLSSLARTARGGIRSPLVAGFGDFGLLGIFNGPI